MAVETGWMAAAETRVPDATKALAEREASMDGKSLAARPGSRMARKTVPAAHDFRRWTAATAGARLAAGVGRRADAAGGQGMTVGIKEAVVGDGHNDTITFAGVHTADLTASDFTIA